MNRRSVVLSVAALAMLVAPFAPMNVVSAQEAAACPADVVMEVSPPTADAPTTVTVTLTPEVNIQPATAGDLTSFHLHYFVDTEPTAASNTIPTGEANILHSASTTQDLGELAPGEHTVTVVLGQVNHTACEVRDAVTFQVAAATDGAGAAGGASGPAPAVTGNAGIVEDGYMVTWGMALSAGLAMLFVGAARRFAVRRR